MNDARRFRGNIHGNDILSADIIDEFYRTG
jgi:hypothetical protein